MRIEHFLILTGITAIIILLSAYFLIRAGKFLRFFGLTGLAGAKKKLSIIQNLVIQKITAQKAENETFESVLESIICIAADALHAKKGSILLYDKENKGLKIIVSKGIAKEVQDRLVINHNSNDNISWAVFENNKPILIKNIKEKNNYLCSEKSIYEGHSLICVPINTSEATMGVCLISDPLKIRPFTEENLEILKSIAGQAAIIIDNRMFKQKLSVKINELKTLNKVSENISHSLNLQVTLDNITKLAIDITKADACSLRLLNPVTNELDIMASTGLSGVYKEKGSLKIGEGVGGYVAQTGIPVTVPDLERDKRIKYTSYHSKEGLKSLVSVPIKDEDEKTVGIISVYRREKYLFPPEMVDLLTTFANNVFVAIKNASLFQTIEKSYYQTIQSLTLAVDARDSYTNGHSQRVTDLAIQISEELGLPQNKIELLNIAGRLHDIGKIGISDQILLKKGRLTIEEFENMKTHPVKGIELLIPLKFLRFLKDILPIIKHHHERWDGKGYPDNLAKEEIPILARILSVADVYDALTSDRPYRKALSEEKAVEELQKNSGSQFDPAIIDAFMKIRDRNKGIFMKRSDLRYEPTIDDLF